MQTYLSISPRYFASPPNLLIFPTVNFLPREDFFCVNCRVARPRNLLKNAGKCCLFFLPSSVSSLCHFEISFAKTKLFFLLFFFSACFCPFLHVSPRQGSAVEKVDIFIFLNFDSSTIFFLGVLERIKKVPLGLSSILLYIF